MSSSLTYEPAYRKKETLSTDFKLILRKRYGDPIEVTLGDRDTLYLRGLVDCGKEEAQKLIDAIEKYKSILLKEEY